MSDITNIFGGPFVAPPAPSPRSTESVESQFRQAIIAAGLTPPRELILDGQLHRFRSGTGGNKIFDQSGYYVGFDDATPCLHFGDWRTNIETSFKADTGRTWTFAEELAHKARIENAKALREAEAAIRHQAAAITVESIWASAAEASPQHPYLARKGVQPHGLRIGGDGRLIAPLFTPDGNLSSLQYIDANGGKLYHTGGKASGTFWMLGTMDAPGPLYICEGFATAATIHEITQRPCIVAYSASGLVPACEAMRGKHGLAQDIVVVADNDASGTGQRYAEQASAKYGSRVVMPPIAGMDANDYLQAGHDLAGLLTPSSKSLFEKMQAIYASDLPFEYNPANELIENMLVLGTLSVLYGDSNSGKTFFALSLAAAVAMGRECYGRQVDPGLTVYLASESPAGVKMRIQGMQKHYGAVIDNMVVVAAPMDFYDSDEDIIDIVQLIKQVETERGQPVHLIIGDTLARISAGADENSGKDMGPVMARFDQMAAATGAATLIIHHTGKNAAKGARGWSGIRAHIDTEIEISVNDGVRSAVITKQRDLPGKGDEIFFKLEVLEMGLTKFGKSASTCVAIWDENPTAKKPAKLDEFTRILTGAWPNSGGECDREGRPYISKSAMQQYLENNCDISVQTAKNWLKPSRPGSMINLLIEHKIIVLHDNGWTITDNVLASAMLLTENRTG